MSEKYLLISETRFNSLCDSKETEYSKNRSDFYLNSLSSNIPLYNTAMRGVIKKNRENESLLPLLEKKFQMDTSTNNFTPSNFSTPVLQQQHPPQEQQHYQQQYQQQEYYPQQFDESFLQPPPIPPTISQQQITPQLIDGQKTPKKRASQRSKSTAKNNAKIAEDITDHVMQNRSVYPVASNEAILDANNMAIPDSNVRKSVARYLDAAPGEHSPPGTKRLRGILKSDPTVVDFKRKFKPDSWQV